MEDIWKDNEKTGRDQGDQGGKPGINMEDNEKKPGDQGGNMENNER